MARIWVIEDSPDQLQRLANILHDDLGHQVSSFQNAADLLKKIDTLAAPDAIIMDLALRGSLNGYQLAEEILRRRPEIAHRRFCFISGWTREFKPLADATTFSASPVIDKGDWTLAQLEDTLKGAIDGT